MSSMSEAFGRSVPPTFTFTLMLFPMRAAKDRVTALCRSIDASADVDVDGELLRVVARVRSDRTLEWNRGVDALMADGLVATRW